MQPSEFCDLLNDYAKLTAPDLKIEFLPHPQQVTAAVCDIRFKLQIAIGMGEAKTTDDLKRLFRARLNTAIERMIKTLEQAKIE